ncbi:MAG: TonB-dependent receptor [Opitutaceae bacterium]|nr:TonB-dependent receptor [Opitutaceae bacterium]
MSTSHCFPFLLLCAAAIVRGQTVPPSVAAGEKIYQLDTVVVSAGSDAKTAFDLAQGTSILAGDELRLRSQATLGDTLAATPGVNATFYGPGASRPIIRGLGGDRVRVLADSVGALDASNISPDHNVAIEPLFASRIEVLRGPATLLYGSSAVGGVVNVIDNRIPDTPGDGQLHGAVEARGFGAGDERAGIAAVGAGQQNLAIQIDALRQKTDDVKIPGVARIDAGAPSGQPGGTLPNSAIDTKDGSFGATAFWSAGRIGASIHRYETVYGVPVAEDLPITIDLKQTRFDLAGDITQPFGIFRSAKLRLGYGRYRHAELDGGDAATTFRNHAWEGRLELPHAAIGAVTGTVGLQAAQSDFSAVGGEVVTPPSRTTSGAVFVLEELKREGVTYQLGARLESQTIRLGEVDPGLPSLPGYTATSGQEKKSTGGSGSLGVVLYPRKDCSVGLSLAYTERLPTAQEFFSNGPHGGTNAYEVGTTGLRKEKSLGLDLSLRQRAGFVTGSISGFGNRFAGYIFEQRLPTDAIPEDNNPEGLTPYQFIAKDALFYGGEIEAILHLVERQGHHVHLDLMADYVHAEQTTDDEPLPRMPPWRVGGRVRYEDARWRIGCEVRHAGRQDHVAAPETETAGYTLLSADVSYQLAAGRVRYELFARGENLTNTTARVSTSFLKEFAPLPGRGVTLGVRASF